MIHMGQNKVSLDWKFVTNDEWASFAATPAPQALAPAKGIRLSRVHKYIFSYTAAIACSAFVFFMHLEREAENAIAQVQEEIQSVITAESTAWYAGDETFMHKLLDSQAPVEWAMALQREQFWQRRYAGPAAQEPIAAVQQIELHGEYVMADVLVKQSALAWLPAPYRETRFYRESMTGWQRTAPRAGLWGPRTELRTDHFVVHFYRRDRNGVIDAASTLDARYLALRQALALPAPSSGAPLAIEITVATAPDWDPFLSAQPHMRCIPPVIDSDSEREQAEWCLNSTGTSSAASIIVLPSPAILPVPQEADDAEVLMALIDSQLGSLLLDEKLREISVPSQWLTLLEGLRLALGWSPILPRPSWFHEVEASFCQRVVHGPPLRLTDVAASMRYRRDWLGILAARTVLEYTIQTQGHQVIPDLIEGVRKHETWQSLLLDVVEVDATEFELGWHAYLSEYPLCA